MIREEYHKELEKFSANIFDCYSPQAIWSIASLKKQLTIIDKLSGILEWMPDNLELRLSCDDFNNISVHGYHSYVQIYLPKWALCKRSFGIDSKKVLKVSLAKARILIRQRINYLASSVTDTELVFLGKLLNFRDLARKKD